MYVFFLILICVGAFLFETLGIYRRIPDFRTPVPMDGARGIGFRIFAIARVIVNLIFLVAVFLIFFRWSGNILYYALDISQSVLPSGRVFLVAVSFLMFATHSHVMSFYFGGWIKRRVDKLFGGNAWPKVIDYPYYIFSVALVSMLIFSYVGQQVSLWVVHLEIVGALYLLSLKLLKTSIEVYPKVFASADFQIRSVNGKGILGKDGWIIE